jgi:hypothetical protein
MTGAILQWIPVFEDIEKEVEQGKCGTQNHVVGVG